MTFEETLLRLLERAGERKRAISELRASPGYYKEEITKSINRKIEELGDNDESIRKILIEVPDLVSETVDNIKIAAIRSHESFETLGSVLREYKSHKEKELLESKKLESEDEKKEVKPKRKRSKRKTVIGGDVREIGEKPEDKFKNRREKL